MTTKIFSADCFNIPKEVEEYFVETIVPLKHKFDSYKLSITGAIASGKSTVLQMLYNLFDKYEFETETIPEYIGLDPTLGHELLKRRISGELTNTTFQNYIMDTYDNKMKKINPHQICFIERLPDDSILCFSNISNYFNQKDLTDLELYVLYVKTKALVAKYGIPSYINCTNFSSIVSNNVADMLMLIIDSIRDDVNNGIQKRIIGLSVSLEVSLQRLKRRSREGEEKYDKGYLNTIINFYENLYHYLNNDISLDHFTGIANLITTNGQR